MTIPISTGSGAASVAAEAVSGLQYQQVEILGQGGGSTLGVNPDASLNASIIGVPNVRFVNSSILAVPVGSIITVWQSSSVLSVPTGSVITLIQAASIAGTYAEDAAHTTADRGIFALGVRNDTQTSITSANNDYSPLAVGPTGGVIAHDA